MEISSSISVVQTAQRCMRILGRKKEAEGIAIEIGKEPGGKKKPESWKPGQERFSRDQLFLMSKRSQVDGGTKSV